MFKGYLFSLADPLEQFLVINLFPGCPVNNWDTSILVLILTLTALCCVLSLDNLGKSNRSIFRNLKKFNDKYHYFYSVYCNYSHNKILVEHISLIEIYTFIGDSSIRLNKINFIYNFVRYFINNVIKFILSIVKENLFLSKHAFFSIYLFSFLIILFFNILGLLPYSITATSSFILILNYSFAILVGLNVVGGYTHLTKYFNQFLPEGVPLFIAPVLALIELFSNVIRIFSLTVRLFANILAGHSLLKIIIGVSWALISYFLLFIPISAFIWFLLVPIFILECVIAFLQAYVYVLLLVIYTNDVINIH